MKRKLQNTTAKIYSVSAIIGILMLWQAACSLGLIDDFLLPSPIQVIKAFFEEFSILMQHSLVTLSEAFIGLILGVLLGFVMAVIMDQFDALYKAFYPLIVLTQTVPTVAIAPLLVLWFGYEMAPKVILIVITSSGVPVMWSADGDRVIRNLRRRLFTVWSEVCGSVLI